MGEESFIVILIITTLTSIALVTGLVLFAMSYNKTRAKHRAEKQRLELEKQEELLGISIVSEENERKRIAQELHDNVNNRLVILKQALLGDNVQHEDIQRLASQMDETISSIRSISHAMLPPGLERFGVCAAIEDLADELSSTTEIEVNLNLDPGAAPKDSSYHLTLFRIAQELIGNTIKYAEATQISISILKSEKGGQMIYSDNGKGFNLELAKDSKSLGLRNIESRVSFIKASSKLFSEPKKGMSLTINWQL